MVKAKRQLEANLKLTDAVLLMLDARAPVSTRHPELETLLDQRSTPYVLVLNKADLAEAPETEHWRRYLAQQDLDVVEMSAVRGRGPGPLTGLLARLEQKITAKRSKKGLLPRAPRVMVAGLPNSGKSTLLNRLVGKTRFKAGKKPGLTRGAQWVTVAGRYDLLDTPGILYPRIEGDRSLATLAALGSVRRDILPHERVLKVLLNELHSRGRLLDLVPELAEVAPGRWEIAPMEALCTAWALQRSGEPDQEVRAFERFLNLFSNPEFPITWERVSAEESP